MADRKRLTWHMGKADYRLYVAGWWGGNPITAFLRYGFAWTGIFSVPPIDFGLRRIPNMQSYCYCPTGYIVDGWLHFFGVGFRFDISADWTKHPCTCDKTMSELFPEDRE